MSESSAGMLARFHNMPNDSRTKTLIVALLLCLVCSVIVSTAAVMLKPLQMANAELDRKRNILQVAGLLRDDRGIDELFGNIETRIVNLDSGEYSDTVDILTYDQRRAARDPSLSDALAPATDLAGIGRRAKYATVYLVREAGVVKTIVLPVHGYGLWSTLYGFLALQGDARSVYGLQFYEHTETPGLGGEVDNPKWRSLWNGKLVFDEQDQPRIEVVRGKVAPGPDAKYQVDGLAGATLTSVGVSNLVRFWLGENGFGPYLAKVRGGMQ
ncbi:MAG: Na(+)-translocating NADH-quinone reductase subunit C [Gammaproteobacteria bacterium]|nr:Na(+)-translocating NADH-quinone reductase subunit C [Gammaproteobacteria bacterium]